MMKKGNNIENLGNLEQAIELAMKRDHNIEEGPVQNLSFSWILLTWQKT